MIQKFFEYKLSTENYNKYYYLVTPGNIHTFNGLLKGKFEGLRAISGNIEMIDKFFGTFGKILIIMDKEAVDKMNELEPIDYYDIEYLSEDYFKVFKRIWQQESNITGKVIYQALQYAKDLYIPSSDSKQNYYEKLKRIFLSVKYTNLVDDLVNDESYDFLKNAEFKNFEDLVDTYYKFVLNNLNIRADKNDIKNILEFSILSAVSYYKDEEEILIKSTYFKIPKGSYIIIKKRMDGELDFLTSTTNDNIIDFLNDYSKVLEDKYKIKVIQTRLKSGKLFTLPHRMVYSFTRYIDKMKSFGDFWQPRYKPGEVDAWGNSKEYV